MGLEEVTISWLGGLRTYHIKLHGAFGLQQLFWIWEFALGDLGRVVETHRHPWGSCDKDDADGAVGLGC